MDKESHQDFVMSEGYLMEMGRGLSPHQQHRLWQHLHYTQIQLILRSWFVQ
jgi:hypothetical protein